MSTWILEPRDPIVVRDGRPNDGRSASATVRFPYPQTIAGAVRTAIGSDEDGAFVHRDPDRLLDVGIRGPVLLRRSGTKLEMRPPRPLDCHGVIEQRDERRIHRVRALGPLDESIDMPDAAQGLRAVGLAAPDAVEGKPPKDAGDHWDLDLFLQWMERPGSADGEEAGRFFVRAGHEPTPETRIHVGIDESSGTALDSALFGTTGLRFPAGRWKSGAIEGLAMGVDVEETAEGEPREGLRPVGGERRLVLWSRGEGSFAWPSIPEAVRRHATSGDRSMVRVVLLTPAIFADGWKPSRILEAGDGVDARLVGAVVPRPLTISGWDFKQRRPKKSRRLARAGSVYWIELRGPADARARWIDGIWMNNVSDAPQDCKDGFGLAAVGVA